MYSGSQIVENLADNFGSTSVIGYEQNSIILLRTHLPAMSGQLYAGSHLKIGVCLSAGGLVRYDNRSWHWKRGSVLITAPHENGSFDSPDVSMLGIAIDTATFCKSCQSDKAQYLSVVVEDEVIASVITAMWTCAEYHGDCPLFIHEGISVLLGRIAALSDVEHKHVHGIGLSYRQISCVTEYIKTHMDQDIKTNALADLVGMKPKQFSRALETSTGITPYKYILKNRMSEAKRYLEQGYCITQVAGLVGYNNPSKFSAAFSRIIGCSPSQWRARKID
ncbi:helix-turn-helix domain-containing protein [Bowmanella denitrificans]|uniref:helix-turn-helix domain-containing protein n=1 Tax=Bowmanella denitrificans TaxID=366582 RepID=UPI0015596A46|nr:AraC family transcriptional regulator [Bowmanella denitrificans]